jgi:hypothetical protein
MNQSSVINDQRISPVVAISRIGGPSSTADVPRTAVLCSLVIAAIRDIRVARSPSAGRVTIMISIWLGLAGKQLVASWDRPRWRAVGVILWSPRWLARPCGPLDNRAQPAARR